MTRTTEDVKYEHPLWDRKGFDGADDGRPTIDGDTARPKGRIRRSMTACNTCRKLKTRCDLDPRGHACRRCLSLRIDCQLPETADRFQDTSSMWSEATTAIPSIEERLISLEKNMKEMTGLLQQMLSQAPNLSGIQAPQLARSVHTDDSSTSMDGVSSPHLPRPVRLIQDLQSELMRDTGGFRGDGLSLIDHVPQGAIDPKLSQRLIQLFVEHFGRWISVYNTTDLHDLQRANPLLYSAACLLGSRYVPGLPSAVRQAIGLQVRQAAASIVWERPPLTHESLQALVLLCLWPATVQKEPPMDSWVLSGISVQHATISFGFLNYAPTELMVNDETAVQLRLWNAVCLTQLHHSVGNARPLQIQQRHLDHCPRILDHPAATLEDARVVAEIQLHLITSKIQCNPLLMQTSDVEFEELERWKMKWAHLLAGDAQSTLELSLWFCQILLHRTTMRVQRQRPEDHRLPTEILHNSRFILNKFLRTPFSTALSAIDHVYFVVGYAALNLCDFNFLDPLIDQTQAFLLQLGPDESHIAYRFAFMISEFKRRCTDCHDAASSVSSSGIVDGSQSPFEPMSSMSQAPPFLPQLVSDGDVAGLMMDGGGYAVLDQLVPEFLGASSYPGHSAAGGGVLGPITCVGAEVPVPVGPYRAASF
ncbi:C6 zinc finger domain protein [Aspergillus candidus]|uniref:Transcriptional activator of proteases prtT n=1 Tax=Aspergillus candidus TaxID=41067 RepID=A0A2I2FC31_ASPCN|nr:C6 zinc finger domain protein [Aspergillus candidus]PLB38184.1 C6 zinc finger domain protein [Aspergillus candidus]